MFFSEVPVGHARCPYVKARCPYFLARARTGPTLEYNPPRFHRMEIKIIEMELHQKIIKLNWKKMEQQSKESPGERKEQNEKNFIK